MDIYNESLEIHKRNRGKIEVISKLSLNSAHDLSIAYTPGVAEVSRVVGKDAMLAREYTIKRNTVAVVTDGSAILGLGNLGPHAALPVMEGKAALFKRFADVDAFPICLATQDSEEIITAVKHLAPTFGGINLEDISAPRCFDILERLQKELAIPVMHDDQQGTAVVTLAGLINALKLRGIASKDAKIVISGAGAAGVAVTRLLLIYGFERVVLLDSRGAIYHGRSNLNPIKEDIATVTNKACRVNMDSPDCITGDLRDALKKTDVFIGVSKPGLLDEEMIQSMNERPIIFAMANPEPEIMPDKAKNAGAYIIATGRSDFPNQVNNVLAFPGIFRGVLDSNARHITDDMLIKAAQSLAEKVDQPSPENILPTPFDPGVADAVAQAMYPN